MHALGEPMPCWGADVDIQLEPRVSEGNERRDERAIADPTNGVAIWIGGQVRFDHGYGMQHLLAIILIDTIVIVRLVGPAVQPLGNQRRVPLRRGRGGVRRVDVHKLDLG